MGGVLMLSLLLYFFVFTTTPTSSATTFPLGSTINPTNSSSIWSSPNSTFSLSFLPLPLPNSPSSSFLPAISYSGGFPIWSPISSSSPVGPSASLSLSPAGDLLLNSSPTATLWRSNTSSLGVASASLDDSGNLRLLNSSSSVLWQSFDHPTDTLVQAQNLTPFQTLSSGPYSFSFLNAGNLTLRWNDTLMYYNRGNSSFTNTSLASPLLALHPNGIVSLLDSSLPPPGIVVAYSSNYGETETDQLRFLRLDSDGNFRAYSVAKGTTAPTARWAALTDQCEVFGYCGPYGVCSYNDSAPVCACPSQNFAPVDAADATKGCRRNVELQSCSNNWAMLQMDNAQFLTFPSQFSSERNSAGVTACHQNCLTGPSCVASTSLNDGSGFCYIKVSEPISGYQSIALPSTSFVKVCAPAVANAVSSASDGVAKSELKAWVAAVVVVGTIAGLVLLEWGVWWCFCRNSPKFGPSSAQYALLDYASGAPVQFSYKELHRSTKGFKEKLGAGGFGAVYRGVLANRTVIAVKRLEGIEQGEKQFRMEVATISSTHHLNLVRLIGFCSEGRHRLLVYEFMKNGSLDAFLFFSSDESSAGRLDWATRFKAAVGTARGITYLHEECRDCIVHCDIKPENILLDEGYNAKVSDFGLAKLVNPRDHRHRTLASVRGTRGYLAPEWLADLPITAKSDVYSYGMVLLETLSGRRNFDVSEETGRKKFSVWAYEEFDKGNIGSIVDKRLPGSDVDMEQLERAVRVSFWCIQEQPSQRPTMGKVVQMLEGVVEIERPPAPKAADGYMTGTSISTTTVVSPSGGAGLVSSVWSMEVISASKKFEKASSSLLASDQWYA